MPKKYYLFLFFFALSGCSQADVSGSYYQAKKKMYKDVYGNKGETFYVNCSWEKKKVDLVGCGLENAFEKKYSKRAKRTEAEHVIPASWMYKVNGEYRSCYYEAKRITGVSPRDYCQDHDKSYRAAHNDLINLRPTVGQINAFRGNKPFSETISGADKRTFRGNGKKVVFASRVIIPDQSIRGDIARIAKYMNLTYGVTYSKRQLALFDKWEKIDPVSEEELQLINRIQRVQKTGVFDVWTK